MFLQLLGLPVSRAAEFIALKNGIIRPDASTPDERHVAVGRTGAAIYDVLREVVEARLERPESDFISMFLQAEVDGERLTPEDVLDIGYLFFLAGLDTVTASLDCMLAHLARNPDHRSRIVERPDVIPHAIEEMLRWESPVTGVVRIATRATEVAGCPIAAGQVVTVLLGSANTDERACGLMATWSTSIARPTATLRSVVACIAASARTSPGWSCESRWRNGIASFPSMRWHRTWCPSTRRASGRSTTSNSSGN